MRSEPASFEADAAPSLRESPVGAAGAAEADSSARRCDQETIPLPLHPAREVHEFFVQYQIEDEVRTTIALAREHFTVVGEPGFQVVNDPECGEHSVAIHVRAEGRAEEVFRQSGAFLDSFLNRVEPSKQKYINLVYHPTSD
jgi:hypothetical protein